jgi:predicted DNA binding protein
MKNQKFGEIQNMANGNLIFSKKSYAATVRGLAAARTADGRRKHTHAEIAALFGVSRQHIGRLLSAGARPRQQNETGRLINADHPRARLTDDEVEVIRSLYELGELDDDGRRRWTTRRLAQRFGVTARYVAMLIGFERRNHTLRVE